MDRDEDDQKIAREATRRKQTEDKQDDGAPRDREVSGTQAPRAPVVPPVRAEEPADQAQQIESDSDEGDVASVVGTVDMAAAEDEIPELQYESDEDMGVTTPRIEHDTVDFSDDDDDDEPKGKKQRLESVVTSKSQYGKIREALAAYAVELGEARKDHNIIQMIRDLEKSPKLRLNVNRRMRRTLRQAADCKYDIAEMYSPPRMVKLARQLGLRDGWSLDLTREDPDDGKPWDFGTEEKRKKAMKMVDVDKPLMLVLSPMCGPFSRLNILFNYPRAEPEKVREAIKEGLMHLKFVMELCAKQHREGRFFLFEHPVAATSWMAQCVQAVESMEGVHRVNFDFCTLGMMTVDENGQPSPAKKRTGILTNSTAIAMLLEGAQCRNRHVHTQLLGGRAGPCQEYPDEFCRLICTGVKREIDSVEWRNRTQKKFDISACFQKLMNIHEHEELATPPDEDPMAELYEGKEFVDDTSGTPLDKTLAIKARRLEIEYFQKMGVYTKVRRERWMKVISTRWLDTNKGDEENPNYRARLVGREIKRDKRDDLFAATPPLESLRMILSICASKQSNWDPGKNFVVMSNDIKRAYFYAPATRPIFVEIPEEDRNEEDDGLVGQLNLSLYGTRDAALNWSKTYSDFLVSIGFRKGKASPCNFCHSQKAISVTVHGDDFTSTGTEIDLRWLDGQLKSKFEVKTDYLGPGKSHSQQLRVLNRVLTWSGDHIAYEPDQRHAELLISAMNVQSAVSTPGVREETIAASAPNVTAVKKTYIPPKITEDDNLEQLNAFAQCLKVNINEGKTVLPADEASQYRALAARANYLALDRPDIQYAVKEAARRMATPTGEDWTLLKRIARYLVGAPRAVTKYYWQELPDKIDTYVDSDWAACRSTGRSTSGGAMTLGYHTIKTWSTTQAVVAMSSGEAELYALTKGAAQTLGLISLAKDLGYNFNGKVNSDANAALGIIQREGLGKLRHIRVQYLWIQDRIRGGISRLQRSRAQPTPRTS